MLTHVLVSWLLGVALFLFTCMGLRQGFFTVGYSVLWFLFSLTMGLAPLWFPYLVIISDSLGFYSMSSLLFLLGIFCNFLLSMREIFRRSSMSAMRRSLLSYTFARASCFLASNLPKSPSNNIEIKPLMIGSLNFFITP